MVRNAFIFIVLLFFTATYIISSDRQFVPKQKEVAELINDLVSKLKGLKDQDVQRVEYTKNEKKLREDLEINKNEASHLRREITNLENALDIALKNLDEAKKNHSIHIASLNAKKIGFENSREEKIGILQNTEKTILEIEKKLQEIPIISSEQVQEIKNDWDQLLYALLAQNNLNIPNDDKPLNILKIGNHGVVRRLRLHLSPDKFEDAANKLSMTDLFKVIEEWDGSPELQAFVKKQKLTRDTNKFIEFVDKLKKSDSWPRDIAQKELNEAKKLWIATLLHSNDLAKHYETMDEVTRNAINDLLNQRTWYSTHNKTIVANLVSFIESSKEQAQFIKLQELQNAFHSYLYRLKMSDSIGQEVENAQYATLKKLWVSIISSDSKNKSLLDMDPEFQTKINHLMPHWGKNKEKMKDVFGVMASEDDTAKLVSSYQPREQFILHLQKLRELDNQGKIILDSDIEKLRTAWGVLKQNNDTFFHDMDEDFRVTTKIYSLPHKWKVSKNRAELTGFFKEALGKKNRLTTISCIDVSLEKRSFMPKPLEQKEAEEELPRLDFDLGFEMPLVLDPIGVITKKIKEKKQQLGSVAESIGSRLADSAEKFRCSFKSWITKYPRLRPLIDPYYGIADSTLAPIPLSRRFKEVFNNLKTFSIPNVRLKEIKELSLQMQLLKGFYNYNWLDRILYPFHRDDLQSLERDFSVLYDEELLKAIHSDTLVEKKGYSKQEAVEITNAIENLKTNLLTRPAKPFEIILAHAILGEALPQKAITAIAERLEGGAFNIIGKIAPNSVRFQYEKDIFSSLDYKIENQRQSNNLNKQALKQRKDILRIEIEKFRIKAGVRFQAPAI